MTKEEKKVKFHELLSLISQADTLLKSLSENVVDNNDELEQRTLSIIMDFDTKPRLHLTADEAYKVIEFDKKVEFDDELDKYITFVNGVDVFCLDRKDA